MSSFFSSVLTLTTHQVVSMSRDLSSVLTFTKHQVLSMSRDLSSVLTLTKHQVVSMTRDLSSVLTLTKHQVVNMSRDLSSVLTLTKHFQKGDTRNTEFIISCSLRIVVKMEDKYSCILPENSLLHTRYITSEPAFLSCIYSNCSAISANKSALTSIDTSDYPTAGSRIWAYVLPWRYKTIQFFLTKNITRF
jgi:hypothetical protein